MYNSEKMNTSIERVFKGPLPDGLYRELYLHFIHFLNEDGSIRSSKLDKQIPGRLYKVAGSNNERSMYGEVEYTFPGQDKPVRLISIGPDYSDTRYGRF